MRRRTFDALMASGGLVIALVLFVGGALLLVGFNFANSNVHSQLADQRIFFPTADNPGLKDPRIGPFIKQYAGQQLVTGAQAEAYADHYIAVHIADTGKGTYYAGKTYAEMGALQKAHPTDTTLTDARNTVFKGETLRGLLLQAYAFWKIGQIALIGAIVAFAVGGVMLVLSLLGFWHARKVPDEVEVLAPRVKAQTVTA